MIPKVTIHPGHVWACPVCGTVNAAEAVAGLLPDSVVCKYCRLRCDVETQAPPAAPSAGSPHQ